MQPAALSDQPAPPVPLPAQAVDTVAAEAMPLRVVLIEGVPAPAAQGDTDAGPQRDLASALQTFFSVTTPAAVPQRADESVG